MSTHTSWAYLSFSSIPLSIAFQAPSGCMGSIGTQPFSHLSRDVKSDSFPSSGWATQRLSQSCPEATCLISWLCAWGYCPAQRRTIAPVFQSALEQVFIHCCIHRSLYLDPQKHLLCMILQRDQCLAHQTRELCFLVSERLQVAFGKLPAGCHVPFTNEWLLSTHSGLIGGLLQRWFFFWKVRLFSQRNSGALTEWPLCSWLPHWLRPFSFECSI